MLDYVNFRDSIQYLDSGAITFLAFIMRYFVFDLQESPKYLVAQGRDEDAIAVYLVRGVYGSIG